MREKTRRVLQLMGLDHFHRLVAMVLASAVFMIALVSYFEVEAHSSAQTATAQVQLKQIKAATTEINGKNQVNFDYVSAYRTWLELDLQAQSAEKAKDTVAMQRYMDERDKIRAESPLLGKKYFPEALDGNGPADSGIPNISQYEVDTYYREVQVLSQQAEAYEENKEFWHDRTSAFLAALAFLSSALFVSGLALTTPRRFAGWLAGGGFFVVLAVLAYVTYVRLGPEPGIHQKAIDLYADGKAMVYRATNEKDYDEAIQKFTKALEEDEEYVNALVARADTHVDVGITLLGTKQDEAEAHFHKAIEDFEEAKSLGHDEPRSLWNVGWVYYLIGDYDKAIATNKEALSKEPELFVVRHNLGLAYLVRGNPGDADLALEAFRESQAEAVRQLKAEPGQEGPGSTWSSLEAMAVDFEALWLRIDGRKYTWIQAPAQDAIADPKGTQEQAAKLRDQLENLIVGLEAGETPVSAGGMFPNRAPAQATKREVTKLQVTGYEVDADRKRLAPQKGPNFTANTTDIVFDIDWTGMENVKKVSWRIYRNGTQDRLRGRVQPWDPKWKATDGLTIPVQYSYTSLWRFKSGYYVFEFYADNVQLKRIAFTIGDP